MRAPAVIAAVAVAVALSQAGASLAEEPYEGSFQVVEVVGHPAGPPDRMAVIEAVTGMPWDHDEEAERAVRAWFSAVGEADCDRLDGLTAWPFGVDGTPVMGADALLSGAGAPPCGRFPVGPGARSLRVEAVGVSARGDYESSDFNRATGGYFPAAAHGDTVVAVLAEGDQVVFMLARRGGARGLSFSAIYH